MPDKKFIRDLNSLIRFPTRKRLKSADQRGPLLGGTGLAQEGEEPVLYVEPNYFVADYTDKEVHEYEPDGTFVATHSITTSTVDNRITVFDDRIWWGDNLYPTGVFALAINSQTAAGGYVLPDTSPENWFTGNAPAVTANNVFFPVTLNGGGPPAGRIYKLNAAGDTYVTHWDTHGTKIYDIEANENTVCVFSLDETNAPYVGKLQFFNHSGTLLDEVTAPDDTYWQSIACVGDRFFVRAHDYIREYEEDGTFVQNITIPSTGQTDEYYETIAATQGRLYLAGYDLDHIRILDRASDGTVTDNSTQYTCPQAPEQTDIAVMRS